MTPDEVIIRIKEIETLQFDDEVAHGREDDLYEDVLEAIAKGDPNAKELAEAVLKTKELKFSRWCA